jgi:MFS family permease
VVVDRLGRSQSSVSTGPSGMDGLFRALVRPGPGRTENHDYYPRPAAFGRTRGTHRPGRGQPDVWVLASTLVIGVSMAAAATTPGWLTLAAVALAGAGEGPQRTALFAVRHRETPEHMRGQVYITAASLKIAGMAAGTALAGPLAGVR